MKALELLRELKKHYYFEEFDIIEKELKALESIRLACKKYPELRATLGIACVEDINLVLEVIDND